MLGAVVFGHEQMQVAINAINELAAQGRQAGLGLDGAGRRARRSSTPWPAHAEAELGEGLLDHREAGAPHAHRRDQEGRRSQRSPAARRRSTTRARSSDAVRHCSNTASCAAASSRASRASTAATCKTVRQITVETGVLPRTHGSALFTRGETQALVTTTLGTGRDAQIIDALAGERKEPFMLHYNFPPFSVGETGMMGSPKRREIGHGNLARRGVARRDADMTNVPVRHPRRLRDPRVERLELDGLGVRHQPRADGRGRADQGAGGRRRDGPGARRRQVPGAHRHPRRRGSPRRHGLQGRRHAPRASPRCRWTSRSTASRARS